MLIRLRPVFEQIGERFGRFDLAVRTSFPLPFYLILTLTPLPTGRDMRLLPLWVLQPHPRILRRRTIHQHAWSRKSMGMHWSCRALDDMDVWLGNMMYYDFKSVFPNISYYSSSKDRALALCSLHTPTFPSPTTTGCSQNHRDVNISYRRRQEAPCRLSALLGRRRGSGEGVWDSDVDNKQKWKYNL